MKTDAFRGHLIDAALHQLLVQFHVGNAVHEQAAEAVGALENGDQMAGAIQLGGGAQAGGTGTDDGDFFAGAGGGRFGLDPAFVPTLVHDGALDVLDGDRRRGDAEDAGAFARGGADAAGEVGEIIGFVEAIQGLAPQAAINQVVPFRESGC